MLLCFSSGWAKPQTARTLITQRDINVMAASLEDARSALIDARLRLPGEDLNAYLRRIAQPLPGETAFSYRTRIRLSLDLLARSARASRTLQRLPALRDTSPANRALWEHTVRALQLFPARVAHTQVAWQRVRPVSASAIRPNANTARFAGELVQTVSLLIALDDGLRDAKPWRRDQGSGIRD